MNGNIVWFVALIFIGWSAWKTLVPARLTMPASVIETKVDMEPFAMITEWR